MDHSLNSAVFVHEWDKSGKPGPFTDVNDVACKELGYTRGELLNLTVLEISVPGKREDLEKILEELSGGKSISFRTTFEAKDKSKFAVGVSAQLLNPKGIPTAFYICTEKDTKPGSDESVIDSEEKYRLLIENLNDGIVISQNDKFIFFNPRFPEMLGYKSEDLLMKDYREVYTPKSIEILKKRKALRDKGEEVPSRYDTIFRRKDGSELNVEANVAIFDYQGLPATFAVIRDITERKKTEDDLKRVHEIYRRAIENAQGVPYRFNYDDETYEFIGQGCEELLGVRPEDLKVSETWENVQETVVTEPDAPKDPNEYVKAFKKGEAKKYKSDFKIVTPRGEEKWLSDCAVAIHDEKTGKVIGSLGILQDITERKRSEEELRRLHEVYRAAIENAQGVPYILNYSTDTYEFFGKGSQELLGVPPQALTHKREIKKLIKEVIVTDPQAQVDDTEYVKAIFRGDILQYRADLKILTPQGEEKWLSDCTVTITDEKTGEAIGSLGILQDITHRKRAEEELKNVHQIYLEAIQNARGVPYLLNYKKGSYEFIGERCEELLGLPPEDVTIDTLKHLIKENILMDPEAPSDFNEYIQSFLKGDIKRYRADIRIVTPKGEEKWLSDCSVKVEDEKTGEVIGMLGILQDITDRKHAEEELRRIHKIYLHTIENAQGVPYRLNYSDYTYDYIGEGCEALFGFPANEFTYHKLGELRKKSVVTDPDAPSDAFQYGASFRRGEVERFRVDILIETPDGKEKWISDCSVPVCDEKTGKVIGSMGILQDITDRKLAEQALKDYAERLEEMVEERTAELKEVQEQLVRKEKLAVLGQLAGGVGHELRNPLSVINNAIYYLKIIQAESDKRVKDYLDMIASEVKDAEKIVSDLLEFSRTKPAEKEELSLPDLVNSVLAKIIPPEEVEIKVNLPPELPLVYVDPRQISQVILNLVTNAFEAMPEGGIVTFEGKSQKDQVRFSVADKGCGITQEHLKKIFEPLFTTKERGIGLGLSITKNLVETNGGSLEVETREGEGSRFIVLLTAREKAD